MSSLTTWLWGTSQLDDAIDKATSELLPAGSEDIALNLEICDQIRSKSVPAKDAMRALKRRLNHKNPNVQLLALGLTDTCIKNGGDLFLAEIASREFMDNLVSILKIPILNIDVKNTILRLIQNWSVAFEGKPTLGYVGQVYRNLVNEGFKFPPKDLAIANSAMVDTQTAPEWIDSDVCLRCRTPFTFTNRKHHCRNCGQVFDQQCSSKTMALPHFGITQEVRVCDGCHNKLTKKAERPAHRQSTRHRSARELADAELQRAIELSLQEVGAASGRSRPGYVPYQPSPSAYQYSEPPLVDHTTKVSPDEDDDPDLRAAIEASLREANAPKPSAPMDLETPRTEELSRLPNGYSQTYHPGEVPPHPALPKIPNYDLEPLEADAILTFSQTVEHLQAQGGRDISRYPAVNELYDKANSLRPKLALSLDDTGRKERMLSEMHGKLSEAVKLYDQLLTEQLAHPRWRTQSTPTPSYQTDTSVNAEYSTVNGYTQWTPQTQVQTPVELSRQVQSPPPTTYPTQAQWNTQPPMQYVQQVRQPTHSTPIVQSQQSSQYTSSTSSMPLATTRVSQSPSVSSPVYQTMTPTTTAPPVSLPQSPRPPVTVLHVSSPPPLNQTSKPSSPKLTRHSTVTYAPSAPKTIPSLNPQLSRSNTVTSAQAPSYRQNAQQQYRPSQPPYQQQEQQQQFVASPPPPPSTLPEFPVAPTSAPVSFPMYGPSIPSGIVRTEERKEALLIDL